MQPGDAIGAPPSAAGVLEAPALDMPPTPAAALDEVPAAALLPAAVARWPATALVLAPAAPEPPLATLAPPALEDRVAVETFAALAWPAEPAPPLLPAFGVASALGCAMLAAGDAGAGSPDPPHATHSHKSHPSLTLAAAANGLAVDMCWVRAAKRTLIAQLLGQMRRLLCISGRSAQHKHMFCP
jgi:hypothetical protein